MLALQSSHLSPRLGLPPPPSCLCNCSKQKRGSLESTMNDKCATARKRESGVVLFTIFSAARIKIENRLRDISSDGAVSTTPVKMCSFLYVPKDRSIHFSPRLSSPKGGHILPPTQRSGFEMRLASYATLYCAAATQSTSSTCLSS